MLDLHTLVSGRPRQATATNTRRGTVSRARLPLWVAVSALVMSGQAVSAAPAQANRAPSTWYVSADGNDANSGTKEREPFGTLGKVESVSGPGDRILVLPSDTPLAGGIVLKPGQALTGRGDRPDDDDLDPSSGSFSVITNSTGPGVRCEGTCAVSRVWIDDVSAVGISAVGGSGDLTVTDVRVSNYNTSEATTFFAALGFDLPLPGILFQRGENGTVAISGSVVGDGHGSGVVVVSEGSAAVEVDVDDITVRSPSDEFAAGVLGVATENSTLDLNVWRSTFADLGVGIEGNATDSGRVHTDARRNDIRSAFLGISTFSPVAPTALSAVIRDNTMSDVNTGVNHNSQSSGTADVQRVVIEHNVITASNSGVTYEHGTFFPGIDLTDHRADVAIRHNHFTITGDPTSGFGIAFPIVVGTNVGGNELMTALIEDNTIVGGPDLGEINPGTLGIFIASFAEDEYPATMQTTIRRNKVKLGPDTTAIGFGGAVGLRSWVQEFFGGAPGAYTDRRPYSPGWDVTMNVEQNCVESTGAGFGTFSGLGWGLGDLTLDLGGGDLASKGGNNFIDTDFDILFAAPFIPFEPNHGPVPDARVIARNNYWGGGDAVVLDQNGLIGTPGYADLPDTSGFRDNGPTTCGSFGP